MTQDKLIDTIYKSAKETRHPLITNILNLFSLNYLKQKQIKLLKKQM